MAWLLDTNIVSELRKGRHANENVRAWASSIQLERQYISVLTLGEINRGILKISDKDHGQAESLTVWFTRLKIQFAGDVLPVSAAVAEQWGKLNAQRTLPVVDGLLAATALILRLRIATRNSTDFEGTGVKVRNPFDFQG